MPTDTENSKHKIMAPGEFFNTYANALPLHALQILKNLTQFPSEIFYEIGPHSNIVMEKYRWYFDQYQEINCMTGFSASLLILPWSVQVSRDSIIDSYNRHVAFENTELYAKLREIQKNFKNPNLRWQLEAMAIQVYIAQSSGQFTLAGLNDNFKHYSDLKKITVKWILGEILSNKNIKSLNFRHHKSLTKNNLSVTETIFHYIGDNAITKRQPLPPFYQLQEFSGQVIEAGHRFCQHLTP